MADDAGARSKSREGGCNTGQLSGADKRALLINDDFLSLLEDVLPVQRVEIAALLVVARTLLLPTLKFLNV